MVYAGTEGAPERAVDTADARGSDHMDVLPRGFRLGDWEVVELIGTGGWSTVYAGRPAHAGTGDQDTGPGAEPVALKVLPTAGLTPRQAREVAEAAGRELELGRRASHPRLIRLLDSLVLTEPEHPSLDGAIVLVMERADCSLRDLLATGTSEAEGARIIGEVCEGLAYLHRGGWVHGDLKPDNVLVGPDGSARLSDFGLATELTGTHGYAPPMGTLDYLPPERWKSRLGVDGVRVRPSADVWALGIVIHEVFASGASPFPGATPAARSAAAQEYADGRAPLRMDNAVPPFWRALAADCLAPTHAARTVHTAESLLTRITAWRAAGTEAAGTEAAGSSGSSGNSARSFAGPGVADRPAARSTARGRGRIRGALVVVAVCAPVWACAVRDDAAGRLAGSGRPVGRIRVFNAEERCQDRTDRRLVCSLGLAIDPLRPYTPDNVVPVRVWDGDILAVDCQLSDGTIIVDEEGTPSTHWYRVRLPSGSARSTAWLPAVRTRDRPAVPRCLSPTAHRQSEAPTP